MMSQADRMFVTAIVLLASVFPVELFPNQPQGMKGSDGQYSGKQGDVIMVKVSGREEPVQIEGRFLGRRIQFFRETRNNEPPGYLGLVGVDLQDEPGTHELTVDVTKSDKTQRLSYNVLVMKEKFPTQHLKLPQEKVDLDEKTLARVKLEQEQVKTALAAVSEQRAWQGSFIEPVHGTSSGVFGSIRIINGQAKNPHNGADIAAPLGTDVLAMNDGTVRLTVEHFFSGKGILLDHGLGLYSMYFHLSEIGVKEGEAVKTGQIIGKVGATGRATGPHLHVGANLNGARVNPYSLIGLPFGNSVDLSTNGSSPSVLGIGSVDEGQAAPVSP
ncbi:MAG: M23 family metallopeptidase [Nitrospiraceae bacterium]